MNLTERKVLALERVKEKLRKLRDNLSATQASLREIGECAAELVDYDCDVEQIAEDLQEFQGVVSDAIDVIEVDIQGERK